MKTSALRSVVFAALIAAFYVVLTWINPLSYGQVQFRASELLTVLACFTPVAIPGLTVGCLIANLLSFMPLDIVFGTLATLIAAVAAYALRGVCIKGYPVLSAYCPVLANGVIVGAELCWLECGGLSIGVWLTMALWVALGELVVCSVALVLAPLVRRLLMRFHL